MKYFNISFIFYLSKAKFCVIVREHCYLILLDLLHINGIFKFHLSNINLIDQNKIYSE